MENCAFHRYIEGIMDLVRETDLFIDRTEPFKLAKDEMQRDRLETILYTCTEAVRVVLLYLRPIMPEKADIGLGLLGLAPPENPLSEAGAWGGLTAGTKVCKGPPLFPRKQ